MGARNKFVGVSAYGTYEEKHWAGGIFSGRSIRNVTKLSSTDGLVTAKVSCLYHDGHVV